MSKIYQNQPLKLLVDTGENLNVLVATTTDLFVKKPDGTTVTWIGSIAVSASESVEYDCIKDVDLEQVGRYSVQAMIDNGDGPWPGDSVQFEVHEAHT